MPKAVKTASGNYRVQYRIGDRRYSVTAPTAKQAELKALQAQTRAKKAERPAAMTFGDAVKQYIESKSNILSPSTLRGYTIIMNNSIDLIKDVRLSKLTDMHIQNQINENAAKYSSKSVKNQYGLISAVLKQQKIDIGDVSVLPPKKTKYNIPDVEQLQRIISASQEYGDLELYLLFVMMLGIRPSEALALKWENYKNGCVHVDGAVVPGMDHKPVEKVYNKTYHSTRELPVPDYLRDKLDAIKRPKGTILKKTYAAYQKRFMRMLEKHNIPPCRVYDLRHSYASIMLMLNVPDKYAMERMGHATPNMLKNVYQHTFDSEHQEITLRLNDFFNKLGEKSDKKSDKTL